MGYATIVSGGTDGRYTISLDYGEATKTAVLNALSVLLAQLDTMLADANAAAATAQAQEAAQQARYLQAVDDFIEVHHSLPPGSPFPDDSAIKFELLQLRQLQIQNGEIYARVNAVKFERAQTLKRIAYWNQFDPSETRDVWCADLTEDAEAGAFVATMDIPGESALMVLAPGCRTPTVDDGQMVAREVMSPEQVFFNAAILPGWQIDKPTYRWGTVTGINYDDDTLDVNLAAATSSAQSLNVNRETALAAVPADYMDTGVTVYEIDDRVVVMFEGQSWDSPRVMGFLDNPKPVGTYEAWFGATGYDTTPALACLLVMRPRLDMESLSDDLMALAWSDSLTVEYRINRGSWTATSRDATSLPGSVDQVYYYVGTFGGIDGQALARVRTDSPQLVFRISDAGGIFADGDIVEVAIHNGAELLVNYAVKLDSANDLGADPTAKTPVQIVGRIVNLYDGGGVVGSDDTLARLTSYKLLMVTGD